ncbi:hypothetical protein [Clostridium estertheticum]|uniref:hypothetical protein n=1 Tax=Clostridium estertheticum TaxID=238834 RepID=UPI001CF4A25A|nr:hypothetical protein [Clostridium estertheticum]MCB2361992.1 hypothetical protein [Clostridium estertheticum]
MTVTELIEILQQIKNPNESKVMVNDTAAGYRDIEYVENTLDLGINYIICTKRPKKGK